MSIKNAAVHKRVTPVSMDVSGNMFWQCGVVGMQGQSSQWDTEKLGGGTDVGKEYLTCELF